MVYRRDSDPWCGTYYDVYVDQAVTNYASNPGAAATFASFTFTIATIPNSPARLRRRLRALPYREFQRRRFEWRGQAPLHRYESDAARAVDDYILNTFGKKP